MTGVFKYSLLFVFLIHLMTASAGEGAVGLGSVRQLTGLVGDLGGLVLQPVVCLEESVVALLQELLGGLGLGAVANLVLELLAPILDEIKGLLVQILDIL